MIIPEFGVGPARDGPIPRAPRQIDRDSAKGEGFEIEAGQAASPWMAAGRAARPSDYRESPTLDGADGEGARLGR